MDCSVTDSFCNDAKREYHYSWRKYSKSSFKTYLKAKDAYEFYYKHPDIAVKDQFGIDNNGEEVDSYTLGSIYSENVKHQLFQPVSDDASLRAIELARANGNTATFSALIFGLAIQLELMYRMIKAEVELEEVLRVGALLLLRNKRLGT